MKNEVIEIVRDALGGAIDNLYRANLRFKGMTEKQLSEKYGQSDSTCKGILVGYQNRKEELERCIEWVYSQ